MKLSLFLSAIASTVSCAALIGQRVLGTDSNRILFQANDIIPLTKLYYDATDPSELIPKLQKVSDFFDRVVKSGDLFSDHNFTKQVRNLYEMIINEIVPKVLKYQRNPVISTFIDQFIVLNDGVTRYIRYLTPLKAAKLLYVHGEHTEGYDRLQKQLVLQLDEDDLYSILSFYASWRKLERYMIPLFFLERGGLGRLRAERKDDALKAILSSVLVALEDAKEKRVFIRVSVDYGQVVLYHSIFNGLDYSVELYAHAILTNMGNCILSTVDLPKLLLVSKHLFETESNFATRLFVFFLLEPAFTRLIARRWDTFGPEEISIWENVVLSAKVLYEQAKLDHQISLFEQESRDLFSRTVENISGKIDLVNRALKPFDGSSYEQEIQLLFELHDLLASKTLPLGISVRIYERIVRSQARYTEFTSDNLKGFAGLVSALVYIQRYGDDVEFPDPVIESIRSSIGMGPIPAAWEEKFKSIVQLEHERLLSNTARLYHSIPASKMRAFTKALRRLVPELTKQKIADFLATFHAPVSYINSVIGTRALLRYEFNRMF